MSKPKDGFESVTITTEPENLKQSLDNPTKSPTASDTTPATTTTTKPERLPKNFGSEYVCPDASSNIFSRLTYSWIDPLFWVGAKRPLDFKDIWQLSDYWKVENLLATFESAWQDELAIAKANREEDEASVIHLGGSDVALASTPEKGKRRKEPSLMRAMWRSWGWRLGPIGIVKMFSDLASILSPFIVKHLLSYVQESRIIHEMNKGDGPDTALPSLAEGFGYALGLFFLQIIGTLLLSNFFQRATAQGMAMRGALAAAIYRKSLKLSAAARQDFSSGKVMTIVATDTQRVEQFVTFLHMIWTAPVQIAVITVFLLLQIGPASLAGIGLLLILAPVQMFLLRKLSAIRRTVAPLTDSRVKLTQEVLQGIRVIKFFAWENPFLEKIEDIREKEVNQVFRRSFYNAFVMAIAFGIPVFSAVVSIAIYGGTRSLDPTAVFPALTWFSQLRFPLMFLPNIIVGWADFKIALQRIGGMLLAAELDEQAPIIPDAPYAVQILDGEFIWETPPPDQEKNGNSEKKKDTNKKGQDTLPTTTANLKSSSSPTPAPTVPHPPTKPTLRNLNLTIPRGSLVAVVGSVGSGKSSLLNALVGEMKSTKGSVSFSGSLGYCPQQAWIQNASLKENVVFWQPFERERYLMALRDCALEQDLKQLPDGDRTMIGERGINLSGGQKQRVNLARVVYFNSDIVLLDDPLSAVDAHVGRYLFENCILGALKDKTRILVTHQLHFLPKVDIVVVMKDGEVAEFGTYAELMASQGEFSVLMRSHGGVDESSASETESAMETDDEIAAAGVAKAKQDKVNLDRLGQALSKESKARTLMSVEERATGSVDIRVWLSYMRAAGNTTFIMGLLIMLILLQAARIGNDMWLVQWTNKRIPNFPDSGYIGVYFAWGISQSLVTYCFGVFFAFASTRAGRVLHKASITRVLRAPVYFFDTTPLGRIINRFSKDQDSMDTQLSDAFRMFSTTLAGTLATFVLIIYATPLFAAPLAPVLVLYYFAQKIYRAVSRELKRLDSLSRSPLYAHVGETLTGLPTIRAYREQNRFVKQNDAMIDTNNAPYYLLFTAQRWMGIRLETLGGLLVFFAATFGILNRTSETLSTALLGLSMSYALEVTQTINWCIRQFTDTEVAMNSVERIEHYAYKIDVEADAIVPSNRPPPGWPQTGEIEVKDLEMKYAPDLPTVLKGVSFNVRDKEKIGVVGRTGSGKSSLMTALFRLTEPTAGSITISGLSTTSIGLRDLRSALAIIPQDPVLFSGSFRTNLDPFSEHTDDELWDALGRANLKGKVVGEKEGLEASVTEGGENLSVGQRQLLCLARAMLKKPRIIILDEATANIDYETDAIIQRSLREDFADATILTIAHRLNTIIDYDRVMVLDAGVIVEYDSPRALLDMEGGRFRAMVEQTGPGNAEMLRSLAK